MIKHFTPNESKGVQKNQKPNSDVKKAGFSPSKLSLSFVFGYSAALKVMNTNTLGNLNILLN